ncbi:MAG: ABC transporter permease [Candidatus Fermentibacteraceae bacterium]|nr:ABC transporter permease [Candidatus Fermentibacteraceae bacterium]MBN2607501.1 ABC transporter permease [Candidatus Fermentibacteraceae bacterium]
MSGFRSPVVIWLIIMPFAITLLLQLVFTTLLSPRPRLAVLDMGSSTVTEELRLAEELDMTVAGTGQELSELVEFGAADMGVTLQEDFDSLVRSGSRPALELTVRPAGAPSSRAIILLIIMDILRQLDGSVPPLEVRVETRMSGEGPSLRARLVPAVVLMVLIVAGIFVPSFLLIGEKEKGTITALLVTPARLSEVLASKAVLGFLLTVGLCMAMLALNGALSHNNGLPLILTVVAGALVCSCVGLIYGCLAPDAKTLYTMVKSLNILLAGPIAFYLVSGIPRWVAMVFPTYWFIDPLYRITLEGAGLNSIAGSLAATLLLGMALLFPVRLLSRRMLGH